MANQGPYRPNKRPFPEDDKRENRRPLSNDAQRNHPNPRNYTHQTEINRNDPKEFDSFNNRWPSAGATQIANFLIKLCALESKAEIASQLDELKHWINQDPQALSELNHQKMSFLHMALYLPSRINKNNHFAKFASEMLFGFLLTHSRFFLKVRDLQNLFEVKNNFGFMILESAIQSGSFQNVKEVILQLLKPGYEKILYNNLTNREGYILHLGFMSGNTFIIDTIIELFSKVELQEALVVNLRSKSHVEYNVLHTVLRHGTDNNVQWLMKELGKPRREHILSECFDLRGNSFSTLQWAINTNSLIKVTCITEQLRQNPTQLRKNLSHRGNDLFMVLSSAARKGAPAIFNHIISLFEKNIDLLDANLIQETTDESTILQLAVLSLNEEVVKSTIDLLSEKGREHALEKNVNQITKNGFSILQSAIRTQKINILKLIVTLLERDSLKPALYKNLTSKTDRIFSCISDAIKSASPEIVSLVFTLAEKTLAVEKWKILITEVMKETQENLLHYAVNTQNGEVVGQYVNTIKRTFGVDADAILFDLTKYHEPFFKYHPNQARGIIFPYLSRAAQKIHQTQPMLNNLGTQKNTIANLFHLARKTTQQAAYADALRALDSTIKLRPEQFLSVSDHGWSCFNYLFSHIYKDHPHNPRLAKERAIELFDFMFERLCQQPIEKIRTLLSSKTKEGMGLLHHALVNDFGESFDKLLSLYQTEPYQDLLTSQLDSYTVKGTSILHRAILSQTESNVDRALTVLKAHPVTFAKLLSHRDNDGIMLLSAAFQCTPPIREKILQIFLQQEHRKALKKNLENFNRWNYHILHDVVNHGNQEALRRLFELIVVVFVDQARATIDKMISNKKFKNQPYHDLINFYAAYPFPTLTNFKPASDPITPPLVLLDTHMEAALLPSSGDPDSSAKHTFITSISDNVMANVTPRDDSVEPVMQDKNTPLTSLPSLAEHSSPVKPTHLEPVKEADTMDLESTPVSEKHNTVQSVSDEENTSATEDNAPTDTNRVPPCGGIDGKYLGEILPQLPEPAFEADDIEETETDTPYIHQYVLTQLSSLPHPLRPIQRRAFHLELPYLNADFYTTKMRPRHQEQLTFVLAGRKAAAFLPQPQQGRCVIVLTRAEYLALKEMVPVHIDMLVINGLQSSSHGAYQNLGLPTPRRLAICLFAYHYKTKCLMIDDNIAKVKFNADNGGWDTIFTLLEAQLANNYCVSVRTDSYKPIRPGEVGSKIFLLDLNTLPNATDILTLFPIARDERCWGEDFMMQLSLYHKADAQHQGYNIVDKELISLIRSGQNRHFFARSGIRASSFAPYPQTVQDALTIEQFQRMEQTRLLLNEIITANTLRYNRRKAYIENVDLRLKHALANHLQANNLNNEPQEQSDESFIKRFKDNINSSIFRRDSLRPYQIRTLQKIGRSAAIQGRVILPTASGKTVIQSSAIQIAYHSAKGGEFIVVVAATIQLVDQYHKSLIAANDLKATVGASLAIPPESVLKICSQRESCNLRAFLMNRKDQLRSNPCVLIFCADSFKKYLTETHYSLPHMPLFFLDEYHYFRSLTQDFLEKINADSAQAHYPKPMVLCFTATEPHPDPVKRTIYRYSEHQSVRRGYIAPVIASSLGLPYSLENVLSLIKCMPLLMNNQLHPGNHQEKKVSELKGVVYFPSIKHCKMAKTFLSSKGVNCYSIHSQNSRSEKEVARFMTSERPGVALVVRKLRVGFNFDELGFVIIAQNIKDTPSGRSNAKQIIGRLRRNFPGNKIGYVLCFSDVYENVIAPLLADQPMTLPVSPDFLAQRNGYYLVGDEWKVMDIPEELLSQDPIERTDVAGSEIQFSVIPNTVENFSLLPRVIPAEDNTVARPDPNLPNVVDTMSILGVNEPNAWKAVLTAYTEARARTGSLQRAYGASLSQVSQQQGWVEEILPSTAPNL